MYEPESPDEINFNQASPENETSEPENIIDRAQAENLSTKNVVSHQQEIKHLFSWLIGIGLSLGLVLGIGVVIAMKKFGLAEKPDQRRTQPNPEQIQNDYLENLKPEKQ